MIPETYSTVKWKEIRSLGSIVVLHLRRARLITDIILLLHDWLLQALSVCKIWHAKELRPSPYTHVTLIHQSGYTWKLTKCRLLFVENPTWFVLYEQTTHAFPVCVIVCWLACAVICASTRFHTTHTLTVRILCANILQHAKYYINNLSSRRFCLHVIITHFLFAHQRINIKSLQSYLCIFLMCWQFIWFSIVCLNKSG